MRRSTSGLYVLPADGTTPTRIVDGNAYGAAWSPDGQWVATVQQDAKTERYELVVVRSDGSGPSRWDRQQPELGSGGGARLTILIMSAARFVQDQASPRSCSRTPVVRGDRPALLPRCFLPSCRALGGFRASALLPVLPVTVVGFRPP